MSHRHGRGLREFYERKAEELARSQSGAVPIKEHEDDQEQINVPQVDRDKVIFEI